MMQHPVSSAKQVKTLTNNLVVLASESQMQELCNAPETHLSLHAAAADVSKLYSPMYLNQN